LKRLEEKFGRQQHSRRGGDAKELEGLSVESEEKKSPHSSCSEPWASRTVPLSPPNPRISGPMYLHSRYDTNRTQKQQAEIELFQSSSPAAQRPQPAMYSPKPAFAPQRVLPVLQGRTHHPPQPVLVAPVQCVVAIPRFRLYWSARSIRSAITADRPSPSPE